MGQRYADEEKYTINLFQYLDVVGVLRFRLVVEVFSPDDAYDSARDSVMPTKGNTLSITSSFMRSLGVSACCISGSAAMTIFAQTTTTIPGSS